MSDDETALASTTPAFPGAASIRHPAPSLCMAKARKPCGVVFEPTAHTFLLPSTRTWSMMTLLNRRPTSLPPVQADPVRCSQHEPLSKLAAQNPNAQTFEADDEPTVSKSCCRPSALRTEDGSATCAHLVPFQRSIRSFGALG